MEQKSLQFKPAASAGGISQEGLKLIACVTMLLDHIGAALLPQVEWLRVTGRIAFPIYCFLLAEGFHYTRNRTKYGLRLFAGVLLSEVPFDFALFGGWTWWYQSVMLTLLVGFLAMNAMNRCKPLVGKLLILLPFAALAELAMTDYGGPGVLLIGLFYLTRELPRRNWIQLAAMVVLFTWLMPGYTIWRSGFVKITIEQFALFAMVPIACYHGRKATASSWVKTGFYLFYPVHLALLYGIRMLAM